MVFENESSKSVHNQAPDGRQNSQHVSGGFKRLKSSCYKAAAMKENLAAIVRPDEPESMHTDDSADFPMHT